MKIHLDFSMELFHGRSRDQAWAQIEAAAELARTLDEPAVLARVALVAERHRGPRSSRAPVIEALLREAHARYVGADGSELPRERLVGNLIARTEAEARANNNDEALAFSLWSRHDSIWGLGSARERAALMAEMETVATRSGDWQTAAFASSLRWVALLEMGDPGYYAQVQALHAMTERFDVAIARMMSTIDRSIIATFRGDFTEAAALHHQLAGFIDGDQDENAYMGQHIRWALLMMRGRFAEAAQLIETRLSAHPPYYPLVTALSAVAQGDPGPGLRHVAENDAGDRGYQRWMEPLFLRLVAELAVLTRDPELCARARSSFSPFANEWLVSLYGCDVSGPVELWLARVDAAEERWAEAAAGFSRAHMAADRMGARPWAVQARLGLAAALLAQGQPAAGLLSEVERDATDLDMPQVAEEARVLATRPAPTARRPATPGGIRPTPGRATADSAAEGAPWSLPWADTTVDGPGAIPAGGTRPGHPPGAESGARTEAAVETNGTAYRPRGKNDAEGLTEDATRPGPLRPGARDGVDGHSRAGDVEDAPRTGADRPNTRDGVDGQSRGNALRHVAERASLPDGVVGLSRAGDSADIADRSSDEHSGTAGGGRGVDEMPAEFRREGDVWRLAFADRVVHLPDAKGLRDLHELLSHPGDDIAAVVLLDPTAGPELLAARRMGGDPVLDDEAKARYKRRLVELDEAIDRAAQRGDQTKLATFDAERRALIDELRAAAGLGGRTRRLGDEAERARKTVTARIRDTLRKIDERHPDLATHLRDALSTGATCRYAPATPTAWHL